MDFSSSGTISPYVSFSQNSCKLIIKTAVIMKAFFRIFSFLLIVTIIGIVLFNTSNTITIETTVLSLKANVGFLISFCAVLGSLVTILLSMSFDRTGKNDKQKLKKDIESTKLSYEIESEKIKQLEAKIKTLEEALKMVTRGK